MIVRGDAPGRVVPELALFVRRGIPSRWWPPELGLFVQLVPGAGQLSKIGFVSQNRPQDPSRAAPNWLCSARPPPAAKLASFVQHVPSARLVGPANWLCSYHRLPTTGVWLCLTRNLPTRSLLPHRQGARDRSPAISRDELGILSALSVSLWYGHWHSPADKKRRCTGPGKLATSRTLRILAAASACGRAHIERRFSTPTCGCKNPESGRNSLPPDRRRKPQAVGRRQQWVPVLPPDGHARPARRARDNSPAVHC
jgi:hypothetical protein